jgi:hypothetical protein
MNPHELHWDVGRKALASCAGPKALESPRVRLQLALVWLQPAPAGLHTGSSRDPGRLQPVPSGSTRLQPAPAGLYIGSSRAPGRLQPVPSGSTRLQPAPAGLQLQSQVKLHRECSVAYKSAA